LKREAWALVDIDSFVLKWQVGCSLLAVWLGEGGIDRLGDFVRGQRVGVPGEGRERFCLI
jgi:hypothetical protein